MKVQVPPRTRKAVFAVHQYRQGVQLMVAACDAELLGQEFREGDVQLLVPADFYDGQRVDEPGLRSALSGATMANLVGPAVVALAVEMGLVEHASVQTVQGVPHAQLMVF